MLDNKLDIKCIFVSDLYLATVNGKFNRVKEIFEKLGDNFDIDKEFNAGETLLIK